MSNVLNKVQSPKSKVQSPKSKVCLSYLVPDCFCSSKVNGFFVTKTDIGLWTLDFIEDFIEDFGLWTLDLLMMCGHF